MSRTPRSLLLCLVCLCVVVGITSAMLITRASFDTSGSTAQTSSSPAANPVPANLARQPEAVRVARRLGRRFNPASRTTSVLTGTLTKDGSGQPVTITRSQSEKGESVDLLVASRALTWRAEEGARATYSTLTDTERQLVERLVYDSSDYFVLAQLRGASYYTVARNLRPDDAPDNYDGPLWTVVRVEEPIATAPDSQPVSNWRLFYLNSSSGLIDKIASAAQGQSLEVNFSDWTERSGEKFPATITWSSNGQLLMTLNLTNLAAH